MILKDLFDFLHNEKIAFAVIGAFALKAYGHVRATRDIDFVAPAEAQQKIINYLEALGFETLHRSRGFSNHVRALPHWERIDFVYVQGETADQLFSQARPLLELEGRLLPVVKAEHLIALKLFAMKNDPQRGLQDMADIQQLLRMTPVDRDEVRGYFEKYGQIEKYEQLTGKTE